MINRLAYKAIIKQGVPKSEIAEAMKTTSFKDAVCAVGVFEFKNSLYIYYECLDCELEPETVFSELCGQIEPFPDGERFIRLYDIFHYNKPTEDDSDWARRQKMTPKATFNRIKPEMLASYIFYHYQYQEEKPGDGNKYGAIYLDGNTLFFYQEEPCTVEPSRHKGLLDTKNSPQNWGELMSKHFLAWEDCDDEWRKDAELLYCR